jgi:hypothetical protein
MRDNWQPIETAPRDGTAILIFEPNGHYGSMTSSEMPRDFEGGFYRSDDPRLIHYDDYRFAIGYWTPRYRWGNRNCADVNPTHWQPLPAPPHHHPDWQKDAANAR